MSKIFSQNFKNSIILLEFKPKLQTQKFLFQKISLFHQSLLVHFLFFFIHVFNSQFQTIKYKKITEIISLNFFLKFIKSNIASLKLSKILIIKILILMLLTNLKIQTRQNKARPSKFKANLKNKNSLPENYTSAKSGFQEMKLTQSHEIQEQNICQFNLNIISPARKSGETETLTKKFTCPEWLAVSQMKTSIHTKFSQNEMENPESKSKVQCSSNQDYENSEVFNQENIQNKKNASINQTQPIMEITLSDHIQNQRLNLNFTDFKRDEDLECKSAFILKNHSEDSDKESINIQNEKNKSAITGKAKSSMRSIQNRQQLEQFYKQQFDKLSEYGLKPCESNRLKKIQQIEKTELFDNNIIENEQQQNQQYYTISKSKKTGQLANKFRKCSAAVQTHIKEFNGKSISKKSVNKQMHSLSKGKKIDLQSNKRIQNSTIKIIKKASGQK